MRMKRINPENVGQSLKDAGMAAVVAVPAAAAVGLAAYGVSKYDYGVPSANDTFSPSTKAALALGTASLVLGALAQMSATTASVGKALIAIGVGAPIAMAVRDKVSSMAAPASSVAAVPPASAPSAGMGFLTGYNYAPAPSLPAAAVAPSAGMGFNAGVSSYYRAA